MSSVHRSGMVRIAPAHPEQEARRAIGMLARQRGARGRGELRQRQPDRGLRIVRVCRVHSRHPLPPATDAVPVLGRVRTIEEGRARFQIEPLALGRRIERPSLPQRRPACADVLRARPRGPERLEQGHRVSPARHGAPGILLGDLPEGRSRLGVRHVMQECHRAVEGGLGARGAGDRDVHGPQPRGSAGLLCRCRRRQNGERERQGTDGTAKGHDRHLLQVKCRVRYRARQHRALLLPCS